MSQETKQILLNREVLAVDQDPMGQPGKPIQRSGDHEIWLKPLDGGAVAAGLFNRGSSPAPMTLESRQLGLEGRIKARDLWNHKDLSLANGAYTAMVPAHGVVLLRLEH
jgi:alpha-galactosidase